MTKSANATEIKSKYRRLALQFHPDKLGHLSDRERRVAEENFKVIAEGKEVLTDPGARKEYDDVIDMLPRLRDRDTAPVRFSIGAPRVSASSRSSSGAPSSSPCSSRSTSA